MVEVILQLIDSLLPKGRQFIHDLLGFRE